MLQASQFYQIKGTLAADVPSYVVRAADEELYQQVRGGNFCYVLTTRQMGKSSLMTRTAERLRSEGTQVAIVDLTGIGGDEQSVTADEWYYGFAYAVTESLGLDDDLNAWWDKRARLPALQRLVRFFRELALAKTESRVVIFVDEIDTTLNLSFADDFFAAIRACFNFRAEHPKLRRLTFVLLGVATPTDLISDPKRTPFNIGTRVELADFRHDEALVLAEGLGGQSADRQEVLDRVLFWTDGHPYLTQKVCLLAAESSRDGVCPASIDRIVESEFFAAGADRKDDNLIFVRNRVAGRGALTQRLLKLYRRVLRGERVNDMPTSAIHNELKLTGLVKVHEDGTLIVRNAIYKKVFGESWIKEVWPPPDNWKRAAGAAFVLLLLSPIFWYEVLYPWQFVDTLSKANGEEANLARVAYERLRGIPTHGEQANRLWGEYNLRRAQWAIDLDQQPNRHQDAFRAAGSAHAESSRFPTYRREADEYLGEFFERRAIRCSFAGRCEDALIWWLKVPTVVPPRAELRSRVNQLVDHDYARLVRTIRTGAPYFPSDFKRGIVRLSQDGTLVAAVGTDGTVHVWSLDRPDGEPLVLHGWVANVSAIAISPDSENLAVGQDDGTALFWRRSRPGAPPETIATIGVPIDRLAFSPNSKHLIMTSPNGRALLWRTDRPKEPPAVVNEYRGSAGAVAFSRDGARIVIVEASDEEGETRSTPRLWWVDRLEAEPVVLSEVRARIPAVEFSPDGKHLVTVDSNGTVRLWQIDQPSADPVVRARGESRLRGTRVSPPHPIAFCSDGSSLATVSWSDGTARLWRSDRPTEPPVLLRTRGIWSCALSQDGSRIATASYDGTIEIWQADHPEAPEVVRGGDGTSVEAVAFNRGGSRLVSLSCDGTTRHWDVKRLAPQPEVQFGQRGVIQSLALSQDGSRVATVGDDGARLWKTGRSDAEPFILPGYNGRLARIARSQDGTRLAAACDDGDVLLWRVDGQTGRAVTLRAGASHIEVLTFSPDGAQLAAGCGDGNVRIWRLDRPTDKPLVLEVASNPFFPVSDVAFSRDGKTLVASNGEMVRHWRFNRGTAEPVVPSRRDLALNLAAPSPDPKRLIVLDESGHARSWSVARPPITSMGIPVTTRADFAPAFSPDRTSIFTAPPRWAHLFQFDDTSVMAVASRPFSTVLPGVPRYPSDRFFRFLDPSGRRLQVAVMPTLDKVVLKTLPFDTDQDPPIEGDPQQLLADWQRRLALKIGEDGEIVPAN